jgi:hypothetical protein
MHSISFGIPRRINQLCYRTIIGAYIDRMPIITADYIKSIAEKCPHIFDKIVLPEGGTALVQNQL